MAVFNGGDAVREFLSKFGEWFSEPVDVYLLGGSATTVRGLKTQTEDIDLTLAVATEFEHVYEALQRNGFEMVDKPTEPFGGVGKRSRCVIPSEGSESTCSNGR